MCSYVPYVVQKNYVVGLFVNLLFYQQYPSRE
jgi:hypothetical protein